MRKRYTECQNEKRRLKNSSNKNCRKNMRMDIGPAGNMIIMWSLISAVVEEGNNGPYSPEKKEEKKN